MKYHPNALSLALIERAHGLKTVYDEHIRDNDELLPHVFMADVTRYVLAQRAGSQEIVQALEDSYDKLDDAAINVVQASFIENIESKADLETTLRGVRGDKLRRQWHRQHTA